MISACQRFLARFRIPAHGHKSLRFIAGTALIAGSFLVYLAYPIILLILPFPGSIKVGATLAVWIVSWVVFSAGIFLAGPEGCEWFKELWTCMGGGHGRKTQDGKEFSRDRSKHLPSVDSLRS